MSRSLTTFLMFQGHAEEATRLYASVFPEARIERMEKWAAGEAGAEGTFKLAELVVAGQKLVCFDSPTAHAFTFTPSMSLFVECDDEAELDRAFAALSADGSLLMPPADYGFSRKFVWLNDRFGVSWQLNWA